MDGEENTGQPMKATEIRNIRTIDERKRKRRRANEARNGRRLAHHETDQKTTTLGPLCDGPTKHGSVSKVKGPTWTC